MRPVSAGDFPMRLAQRCLAILLLISAACPVSAQEVSWQEAVARLARERTIAETCAALLKKNGDKAAQDRGSLAYAEAKSDFDGVVAGLIVALARRGQP